MIGDSLPVPGPDDCKDSAFRALGLQDDELVGDVGVTFVDECPGTVRGELPELLHHHVDHVLLFQRFDIDLLAGIDFRNRDDQGPPHLDLLKNPE